MTTKRFYPMTLLRDDDHHPIIQTTGRRRRGSQKASRQPHQRLEKPTANTRLLRCICCFASIIAAMIIILFFWPNLPEASNKSNLQENEKVSKQYNAISPVSFLRIHRSIWMNQSHHSHPHDSIHHHIANHHLVQNTSRQQPRQDHPHAGGARDELGEWNYVHDPTFVRRHSLPFTTFLNDGKPDICQTRFWMGRRRIGWIFGITENQHDPCCALQQ